MRNCVYHPDFNGSFSLKYLLTPLVPELTYNDLVIDSCQRDTWAMVRLLEVLRSLAG